MMLAWSAIGFGQQAFFLDSLFSCDLFEMTATERSHKEAELSRLSGDYGLSVGISVTNNIQEEIDAGLSTRITGRVDLLSGGWYDNRKNGQILEQQLVKDSLQGLQEAVANNYGFFYNYIIRSFNDRKLLLIADILAESNLQLASLTNLYYNKAVDYNEVAAVQSNVERYKSLQLSLQQYNDEFDKIIGDSLLPTVPVSDYYQLDFSDLSDAIAADSSSQKMLEADLEIAELRYEKVKTPALALTVGYDMSRHQPHYAVRFTAPLTFHKAKAHKATTIKIRNAHKLAKLQTRKELLNLQYEYQYKQKQLLVLRHKEAILNDRMRKLVLQRTVFSLSQSIAEQQTRVELLQLHYERADLQQQEVLILLAIKKAVSHVKIGQFIRKGASAPMASKYEGRRFLIVNDLYKLTEVDRLYLVENEIKTITAAEATHLEHLLMIDPADYHSRAKMEEFIVSSLRQSTATNVLISSIQSLQALDVRTIGVGLVANSDF